MQTYTYIQARFQTYIYTETHTHTQARAHTHNINACVRPAPCTQTSRDHQRVINETRRAFPPDWGHRHDRASKRVINPPNELYLHQTHPLYKPQTDEQPLIQQIWVSLWMR